MLEIILVFVSLAVIHYKFKDTMVDLLHNLHDVYNKWEERAQPHIQFTQQGNGAKRFWNSDTKENKRNHNYDVNGYQNFKRSGVGPPSAFPKKHSRKVRIPVLTSSTPFQVGSFKTEPSVQPDYTGSRPFVGRCCSNCLATSRWSLIDNTIPFLGIKDILMLPLLNKKNFFLTKKFYFLSYMCQCRSFEYPDISGKVLDSERVQEAIEKAAIQEIEENNLSIDALPSKIKKHAKRAKKVLTGMSAGIYNLLLRCTAWAVFKVLNRLVNFAYIHKGQLELIKRASQTSLPILFLPLHRSHLDYILLSFILYIHGIKAPQIAAGDNLRIPFIGSLMRGLGAFFIKRKLDPKQGKRDYVYRAILHTYMEKLLNEGHNLEFFIEGGRSRTGKACMPKAGLMSIVVDAYLDGSIPDTYIVPVGISYEKLLDGNFISEQLGHPKVTENLWSTITAIWGVLNCNYGSLRVDFCQPFSLKEFVASAQNLNLGSSKGAVIPTSHNSVPFPNLRRLSSTASLYGTDIVADDQRNIVKCLAEHVVYDAVNATALMSTHLVAFLLLNKYRKGATHNQLVKSFKWLCQELKSLDKDVGFNGEASVIVSHALQLLGPNLVECQSETFDPVDNNNVEIAYLKPATELPYVIELSYYSNVALSTFVLDSVVANAIIAEIGDQFEVYSGCESNMKVSQYKLLDKAVFLCNILQFEFIFAPPCQTVETVITDAIARLTTKEILHQVQQPSRTAKRIAIDFDSDSEETSEQWLKVNMSEEAVETLIFFRNLLSHLIECYWMVGCCLNLLLDSPMEEQVFLKRVKNTIQERIDNGYVLHAESISFDSLRNAMKLFENWGVIHSFMHDNLKLLSLGEEVNTEEQLNEIIALIEEFKK